VTAEDWFIDWVSPARFERYLRAAGHDRDRARRLYEWNARLSGAFLHDLSHLEIGLRNAYDQALHRAYESGTRRDGIRDALEDLRRFRNRVAHHECILDRPEPHLRRLLSQVRRIAPEAAADLRARSGVPALLERRP
jgi:hypothetical protein